MPRRCLIPGHPLTSTQRSRRHRLRLRGIEPPSAPAAAPMPADWFEQTFGCSLPTLEECFPDVPACLDVRRSEKAAEPAVRMKF